MLDDRWVCKITGEASRPRHARVFHWTVLFRMLIDTRSVPSDYGLGTYRRDDGAEPLSTYQQRVLEVYMPPEFQNSNMEQTLAGDVFRYAEHKQNHPDLNYC